MSFSVYFNSDGYLSKLNFNELDSAWNRNLLRFKPGVRFIKKDLRIGLGLNMVQENDTLEGMNKFHVFPDLNMSTVLLIN